MRERMRQGAGDYDNQEEKSVVEKFETPAAIKLHQGTRNNHTIYVKHPVSDPTKTSN